MLCYFRRAGRTRFWRSRGFAIWVCLVVVLGSCSSDGSSAESGTSAPADSDVLEGQADSVALSTGPRMGGELVVALAQETPTGWTPAQMGCSASCQITARLIFDTLTTVDEHGEVKPGLLESWTPSADVTSWTLAIRPGITFHNGEPLDASAVAQNLEAHATATSVTYAGLLINSVQVIDGLTVEVFTSLSGEQPGTFPWVALPAYLSTQVGMMAAPSQLDDPRGNLAPIGTGPFVFEEWVPNNHFRATRNPDYWRTAKDGSALPRLDRVEVRPMPDQDARLEALAAGEVDVVEARATPDVAELATTTGMFVGVSDAFAETRYTLVNHESVPLGDERVRTALAHCQDPGRLMADRGDLDRVANGPFPPGALGYLEDTGFPEFDTAAAAELIAAYEEEVGAIGTLTFGVAADDQLERAHDLALADMWIACGFDIEVVDIGDDERVDTALRGAFDLIGWAGNAGVDPDQQFIWWHSSSSEPIGDVALNYGRLQDEEVDEQLEILRTNADPTARSTAAEEFNRVMGSSAHQLWSHWVGHLIVASTDVVGLDEGAPLPDGGTEAPSVGGARTFADVWLDR